MTSKNLFFKLMLEDLKRRLWAISLSFLAFFFWMPVMAAMQITDLFQKYDRWILNGTTFGNGITADMHFHELLTDIIQSIVGLENGFAAFTFASAAIIMALTGFLYLHSKKQMDFYHSIPIRREVIFAAKYINGIIIVFVTYLINLVLSFAVLGLNGAVFSELLKAAMPAVLVHMAGYLMIYGLMSIAVLLTGNFFISILGGIVLFGYVPAVIALVQGLMHLFFETVNLKGIDIEKMMINGSPISAYVKVIIDGIELGAESYGNWYGTIGFHYAAGLIFSVIAVLLYRKRPSESAGKSMAFQITKAPIKILLVVPITICISVFFWNIYYSIPWAIFGFGFGLVVSHCIIEIIYHFEFRKLLSNMHHMMISAALSLLTIAVFWFDLVGYDDYLPKESELSGASIYAGELNAWTEYGLPKIHNANHYSWNYIQEGEFIANNMKITDQDVIYALANAGIEHAAEAKARKYAKEEPYVYDGTWTNLVIGYQLNNGKTVYRSYRVDMNELTDVFERLYANKEFKTGVSPIMSYETDSIKGIYEAKHGKIREVKADKAVQNAILNAYKEEYSKLSIDERLKESPITSLRFLTKGEYEYLCMISQEQSPNYTGAFRIEDMNEVNFFPVYPSFEKTLTLLRECGINDFGPLPVDDVQRIVVISNYMNHYGSEDSVYTTGYYDEKVLSTIPVVQYAEDVERTITLENPGDPEVLKQMEEVLEHIVDYELAHKNRLQPIDYGIRVEVYMKDKNEGKSIVDQEFVRYLFPKEQIPEFVNEQFLLDSVMNRDIVGWIR